MEKIAVNIISGFLGSGKTTVIVKLLSQKPDTEKWAVIINEFGRISIDRETLLSFCPSDSVFDISGGCICCSAKGNFEENLDKIVRSANFTRILIEPSGLGGVDMVSEIVAAHSTLQLMPIICLVDIASIENSRLQRNGIYRSQILKADIIAFSKSDLLNDVVMCNKLIGRFKSLFPDKQNALLTIGSNLLSYLSSNPLTKNQEEKSPGVILTVNSSLTDLKFHEESFKFSSDIQFNMDRLTCFFKDHPQIIRAKGNVHTESGWKLLNFTLSGGCTQEPCQPKEQSQLVLISETSEPFLFQDFKTQIEKTLL